MSRMMISVGDFDTRECITVVASAWVNIRDCEAMHFQYDAFCNACPIVSNEIGEVFRHNRLVSYF